MCLDSGPNGINSKSPFALCAVGYAKTHYLLSDSDILSNLFVWNVDDPLKCHGLISNKMKIVLQNKAKALSYEKFGGEEGLIAEKTARAEKSKLKWIEKCETAKKKGQKVPKMPDSVYKENVKDNPSLTVTNFVCVNQKYRNLILNSKRYGFYLDIYGTKSLEDISPITVPTIIVTDATDEVLKERYAGYEITRFVSPLSLSTSTLLTSVDENTKPDTTASSSSSSSLLSSSSSSAAAISKHVPKLEVHDNLVHAVLSAQRSFASVIVDKHCDLRVMINASGHTDNYIPVIGGTDQTNTIIIRREVRIIGTSNGLIQSNNAIFWVIGTPEGCKVHFDGLRMEVLGYGDEEGK
jgi:hypothetical protein